MKLDRPLHEMSVAEARKADLESIVAGRGVSTPVGEVSEVRIPGPDTELAGRIYHPPDRHRARHGPPPVVVYFFGGGWTLGNLDTCDEVCRRLCAGAGALVLSVAYRLAPEHPFPAAPHDCWAACQWAAAHIDRYGGDPGRMAVAGDSAGGNLAAAVTLLARDRGPSLACQVLVYPNVAYQADTASMREYAGVAGFNARSVRWYWGHYLAQPSDGDDPLASPLRAASLRDLPPALVLTAERDPLRDEAERYADRLAAAGVPVQRRRYLGVSHGFFTMTGSLQAARDATEEVVDYLRTHLTTGALLATE